MLKENSIPVPNFMKHMLFEPSEVKFLANRLAKLPSNSMKSFRLNKLGPFSNFSNRIFTPTLKTGFYLRMFCSMIESVRLVDPGIT